MTEEATGTQWVEDRESAKYLPVNQKSPLNKELAYLRSQYHHCWEILFKIIPEMIQVIELVKKKNKSYYNFIPLWSRN